MDVRRQLLVVVGVGQAEGGAADVGLFLVVPFAGGEPRLTELLDWADLMDGGCEVVRSFFLPDDVEATTKEIGQIYQFCQQRLNAGELNDEEKSDISGNAIRLSNVHQIKQLQPFVYGLAQRLAKSDALSILRETLGDTICILLRGSMLRQVAANSIASLSPLHQDLATWRTKYFINCWVSLTPPGEDSPGLEVFRKATRENWTGFGLKRPPVRKSEIDYDAALKEFGGEVVDRPVCQPGDAVLFDNYCLHKTHHTEGRTKPRMNMELRCSRPEDCLGFPEFPENIILHFMHDKRRVHYARDWGELNLSGQANYVQSTGSPGS